MYFDERSGYLRSITGITCLRVFAANEQLQGTLSKTLKAVTGKAAKWRKGELTFKASE
jgi:hypothetical protein